MKFTFKLMLLAVAGSDSFTNRQAHHTATRKRVSKGGFKKTSSVMKMQPKKGGKK